MTCHCFLSDDRKLPNSNVARRLIAQQERLGVAVLLDEHFPTHGNWQGLSCFNVQPRQPTASTHRMAYGQTDNRIDGPYPFIRFPSDAHPFDISPRVTYNSVCVYSTRAKRLEE
jgi:hypothetical protein